MRWVLPVLVLMGCGRSTVRTPRYIAHGELDGDAATVLVASHEARFDKDCDYLSTGAANLGDAFITLLGGLASPGSHDPMDDRDHTPDCTTRLVEETLYGTFYTKRRDAAAVTTASFTKAAPVPAADPGRLVPARCGLAAETDTDCVAAMSPDAAPRADAGPTTSTRAHVTTLTREGDRLVVTIRDRATAAELSRQELPATELDAQRLIPTAVSPSGAQLVVRRSTSTSSACFVYRPATAEAHRLGDCSVAHFLDEQTVWVHDNGPEIHTQGPRIVDVRFGRDLARGMPWWLGAGFVLVSTVSRDLQRADRVTVLTRSRAESATLRLVATVPGPDGLVLVGTRELVTLDAASGALRTQALPVTVARMLDHRDGMMLAVLATEEGSDRNAWQVILLELATARVVDRWEVPWW